MCHSDNEISPNEDIFLCILLSFIYFTSYTERAMKVLTNLLCHCLAIHIRFWNSGIYGAWNPHDRGFCRFSFIQFYDNIFTIHLFFPYRFQVEDISFIHLCKLIPDKRWIYLFIHLFINRNVKKFQYWLDDIWLSM